MKKIQKRLLTVAKSLEKLSQDNNVDKLAQNIMDKLTEVLHLMEDISLENLDSYSKQNLKAALAARRKLDGFILNIALHQNEK